MGIFVFDLRDFYLCIVFQERVAGTKLDLPLYIFVRECRLCIPPRTRYWGTRHRLASSALTLNIHQH